MVSLRVASFGLALILWGGCSGDASKRGSAKGSSAEPLPGDELHMLLDCPWVAEGCDAMRDGCSETEGHATRAISSKAVATACGASVPDMQLVADVAGQLESKPELSRVRILAPRNECGAAVRQALVDAGAASERIEVSIVPDAHYVRFEVAAFRGVTCGPRPR